jgi:predicted amidophosphoribosyltransferase
VTASSPHLVTLLVTLGAGLVMCRMGFRERRLLARRERGRCASCRRQLDTRGRCSRCG